MPPFHTAGISKRVGPEIARLIEEDEAKPAADHDAEGDPQQKIVGLAYGHRRLAVPQIGAREEIAPVEPAEQDAGHIGEAVPADGERPDLERNRIDDGVGIAKKRHVAPGSAADGLDPSPPDPACQGGVAPGAWRLIGSAQNPIV
jgi:hypothetical protein